MLQASQLRGMLYESQLYGVVQIPGVTTNDDGSAAGTEHHGAAARLPRNPRRRAQRAWVARHAARTSRPDPEPARGQSGRKRARRERLRRLRGRRHLVVLVVMGGTDRDRRRCGRRGHLGGAGPRRPARVAQRPASHPHLKGTTYSSLEDNVQFCTKYLRVTLGPGETQRRGHARCAGQTVIHRRGGCVAGPTEVGVTFGVFGTTGTLMVSRPQDLAAACAIIDTELANIDLACSRFREDSELSRLNRADGAATRVGALFAEALEVALRAARLTDGDLDPTCGRALIDLGYDRDFAQIGHASARNVPVAAPAAGWRRIGYEPLLRLVHLPQGTLLDLGATAKAWAADRCAAKAAG